MQWIKCDNNIKMLVWAMIVNDSQARPLLVLFSRVHATLHLGLSVGRSVGRSVGMSVTFLKL